VPKPAKNLSLILFIFLAIVSSAQRSERPGNVPAIASQNHHHRVSTKNEAAQRFFDQGLTLIYALDYSEAAKAFERAGALDPTIAMAYWGISYSMSSDYYYPTPGDPVRERQAYEALQKAVTLSANGPQAERAYISALGKRFCACPNPDRQKQAVEFKDAMRDLSQAFPDDLDAATLYAQSIMNLSPWDLWNLDGTPWEETQEVLSVLESVLKRDPHHVGAIHYYIHAVEASPHPERALVYANRLPSLSPPIGHLIHMPAHIYVRTGDYLAAEDACAKAARIDDGHIQTAPSMFTVLSYLHDLYFLATAASMDGHLLAAKDAADKLADRVAPHVQKMPELQAFLTVQPTVLVRFHRWDEILKLPAPDPNLKTANAIWHFARGMALASTAKVANAETEQRVLTDAMENIAPGESFAMSANVKTHEILRIAVDVLAAKLAAARHENNETLRQLKDAIAIEDGMKYGEPPGWFYPVRESLGAALFLDGKAYEAEQTFREDLARNPRNPRSLFGLLQALRAQSKSYDATFVQVEFDAAWKGDPRQLNLQSF
jgi:tetratricopeptide (TPR) repeat protein